MGSAYLCELGSAPRHILVAIGKEGIALPMDEASLALGLDFGPGSIAVVLYSSIHEGHDFEDCSRVRRRS
jgi:hypothetical protein